MSAQLMNVRRSGSSVGTTGGYGGGLLDKYLVPTLTGLAAIAVARKLWMSSIVAVEDGMIAVVYNDRRRTVFSTSSPLVVGNDDSNCGKSGGGTATPGGRGKHQNKKKASASSEGDAMMSRSLWMRLLFPVSERWLIKPPLPLFRVFLLPKTMLTSAYGGEINMAVQDVPTLDGCTVRLKLCLKYYLSGADMNRYLSIVGPQAPSERIGEIAGKSAKQEAFTLSSGVLLNKTRRNSHFEHSYHNTLQPRLLQECCVRLIEVKVEHVELVE